MIDDLECKEAIADAQIRGPEVAIEASRRQRKFLNAGSLQMGESAATVGSKPRIVPARGRTRAHC